MNIVKHELIEVSERKIDLINKLINHLINIIILIRVDLIKHN